MHPIRAIDARAVIEVPRGIERHHIVGCTKSTIHAHGTLLCIFKDPKTKPRYTRSKQLLLNVASTPNKRVVLSNSGTEATLDGTSYCLSVEL